MKAILSFFKDLLLISDDDKGSIGLSQFKGASVQTVSAKVPRIKNVTLTDLMRKGE